MLKSYLLALINSDDHKLNSKNLILVLLIFFPSFMYGGNNLISFFLSTFFFQFFFIKNLNFSENLIHRKLIIAHILLIIYLCFQLIPFTFSFFNIFSKNHTELYSLLSDVSYRPLSLNVFETIKNIIIYFNILILFLITPYIIKSKRALNFTFQTIIIIGLIHVIFGLFIEIFEIYKVGIYQKNYYLKSLTGFFINRNNFSFFLLLIFIVNFYYLGFYKKYFLKSRGKISNFFQFITSNLIIYRATLAFISIGIILTKSRAGNLSFIIILLLIVSIEYFRNKKINLNILIVLSVISLDILVLSNILGLEKLVDRISATSIDGEASRLNVFIVGLNEFLNFPFFGYGHGGFEVLFRLKHDIYSTFYNHVHNDFIQLLGELGAIGIFLFCFWIFQIFKIFKENSKNNIYELNMIILLSAIVAIIHGNLDFALHIPSNFYFLFFIFSLSLTKIKRSISN